MSNQSALTSSCQQQGEFNELSAARSQRQGDVRAKLTLRVGLGRPASSSGVKCVSRYILSLLRLPLRRERAVHSSVLGFEYDSSEKLASTTPIRLSLGYDYVQIVTDVPRCIRARKTAFRPWSTSKSRASVGNKAVTGRGLFRHSAPIFRPFIDLSTSSHLSQDACIPR